MGIRATILLIEFTIKEFSIKIWHVLHIRKPLRSKVSPNMKSNIDIKNPKQLRNAFSLEISESWNVSSLFQNTFNVIKGVLSF